MPIPRRLIVIAAGALGAGAVMYLRNKAEQKKREQREHDEEQRRKDAPPATGGTAPAGTDDGAASATADGATHAGVPGAEKELARFLAGESWHDEMGWNGIWDREGIEGPDGWLRAKGKDVLRVERQKLVEHPALLAGCRRRWIVVCRYAGIDVADAAGLWNQVSEV